MVRRHSDVLLAGLLFVGSWFWLATHVREHADLDRIGWSLVCFAATFAGAQIVRRALPTIGIGDTTIAAAVAIAIVVGMQAERSGAEVGAYMLLPIGASTLGALAGSLTSRRRAPIAGRSWLMLAAGFAAFGGSMLAGGVCLMVWENVAVGAVVGAVIGGFVATLLTPITARQAALGLAILSATLGATHLDALGALLGFVGGFLLGAIGARIGETLRPEPGEDAALPEAQVR